MATGIRIASSTACFQAAGINNGLAAGELGISYLLPRTIGSSRATDIMLTGQDADTGEAERIGLVSQRLSRMSSEHALRGQACGQAAEQEPAMGCPDEALSKFGISLVVDLEAPVAYQPGPRALDEIGDQLPLLVGEIAVGHAPGLWSRAVQRYIYMLNATTSNGQAFDGANFHDSL